MVPVCISRSCSEPLAWKESSEPAPVSRDKSFLISRKCTGGVFRNLSTFFSCHMEVRKLISVIPSSTLCLENLMSWRDELWSSKTDRAEGSAIARHYISSMFLTKVKGHGHNPLQRPLRTMFYSMPGTKMATSNFERNASQTYKRASLSGW